MIELTNVYGDIVTVNPEGAFVETMKLEDGRGVLFPRQWLGEKDRGGVPVCAPVFGPGDAVGLAQHGFARNCTWEVAERNQDEVKLTLVNPAFQVKNLPVAYGGVMMELTIHLDDEALFETLTITNDGSEPFVCTPAFHPYFPTSDATAVALADRTYVAAELFTAQVIAGPQPIVPFTPSETRLTLASKALQTYIVWSADPDKYICVEPTSAGFLSEKAARQNLLQPGESKTVEMELTWE